MSWDCYLSLRLTPYLWYFTRDGRSSLLNFKNLVLVFTYWWISTRFSYSSTEYWMEFTHRFASIIRLEYWWVSLHPETYNEKLQNITICQWIIHAKMFTGNQANNYETFYFKTYFTFFSSQFTNVEWTKTNTAFIYLRETSMFCQMWHITYSHTHPREPYVNMCIAVWMPKM